MKLDPKDKKKLIIVGVITVLILIILIGLIAGLLAPKSKKETGNIYSNNETPATPLQEAYQVVGKTNVTITRDITINSSVVSYFINTPNPDINKVPGNSKVQSFIDYLSYDNGSYYVKKSYKEVLYVAVSPRAKGPIFDNIDVNFTKDSIKKYFGINDVKMEDIRTVTINSKECTVVLDLSTNIITFFKNIPYDIKPFIMYTKDYLENRNVKTYVDKLKEAYPWYDTFDYTNNRVTLTYPNMGISLVLEPKKTEYSGIMIFKNNKYIKEIRKELDPLESNKVQQVTYINSYSYEDVISILNSALTSIGESQIETDGNIGVGVTKGDDKISPQKYNGVVVYSLKNEFAPYNISSSATADFIFIYGGKVYYGINNNGVFVLNPYTQQTQKVLNYEGKLVDSKLEGGKIILPNGSMLNLN